MTKEATYHWCIKTKDGVIYADSDSVRIQHGVLKLVTNGLVVLAFSQGEWKHIYAASAIDGNPVAVTSWSND